MKEETAVGDGAPVAPARFEPAWVSAGPAHPRPLVAFHTWTTETEHYANLSAAMGGYPIVSILPPSPDGGSMPRRTVQWVDHAETVLRTIPIEPPYLFVGWSFGGVVAVELARRLKTRADDAVTFVGMIDTTRPRLSPLETGEYVWYHLGVAANLPNDHERFEYLKKRGLALLYRRFPRAGAAARKLLERAGLRSEQKVIVKATDPRMISVHTAYLNYRGDAVPFPVSLYTCARSKERAHEAALGWDGWLRGGYELASIPGGHFRLWEDEHIGAVGAAILRSLAKLDDPLLR